MKHIIIILMVLISWDCFAQSPQNSSVKNCTLTFVARASSYVVRTWKQVSPAGHTYVRLTADITWKASGNGWRMKKELGFYKEGARGGKIRYETIHSGKESVSYTITITPNQFYEIIKLGEKWNCTDYKLGTYDCITFVQTVARMVKQKIPTRLKLFTPTDYIIVLKRAN